MAALPANGQAPRYRPEVRADNLTRKELGLTLDCPRMAQILGPDYARRRLDELASADLPDDLREAVELAAKYASGELVHDM